MVRLNLFATGWHRAGFHTFICQGVDIMKGRHYYEFTVTSPGIGALSTLVLFKKKKNDTLGMRCCHSERAHSSKKRGNWDLNNTFDGYVDDTNVYDNKKFFLNPCTLRFSVASRVVQETQANTQANVKATYTTLPQQRHVCMLETYFFIQITIPTKEYHPHAACPCPQHITFS